MTPHTDGPPRTHWILRTFPKFYTKFNMSHPHADHITTNVLNPKAGGETLSRSNSMEKETASHHEKIDSFETDPHGPVDQFGGELQVSPEEKRLIRKLDVRIMPILWS